jgi:S-DNA-T family DNA segregation ATPase FtsK/SpoIIIE
MAHSLNRLNSDRHAAARRSITPRFIQEIGLLVGLVVLAFVVLALATYSPGDPSWSTSGAGGAPRNWAGVLGAWVADLAYLAFGFSAWWLVAILVHVWAKAAGRWMGSITGRLPPAPPASRFGRLFERVRFWLGSVLLLAASCGLEWTRLYHWDAVLPGPAGGMLGFVGGPLAVKWLGFTGSALLGIAALVVGVALVFHFSWGRVAERIGAALEGLTHVWRSRREAAEDLELGSQAAHERDQDMLHRRRRAEVEMPAPVQIEPTLAEVPKSVRVA